MDDEDSVMEMEDVELEGSNPISKLPEYIFPCRGKTKVSKDIDESKVTLHTPLLLEQIVFEGPCLGHVPLLKLEDWDLVDTERFSHLVTDQLMHRFFHKNTRATALESSKWMKGMDKAGLLNLLWVPHYNCAPITMIVIKQLLFLVHEGCLWLEEPIPITDMLIHRVTRLSHSSDCIKKADGRYTPLEVSS